LPQWQEEQSSRVLLIFFINNIIFISFFQDIYSTLISYEKDDHFSKKITIYRIEIGYNKGTGTIQLKRPGED